MPVRTLPSKVIIAGAGLAGPALAIALAKHSIRSIILERRPQIDDIGGVIMLAPNAMRVMDSILGVGDEVRSRGYQFDKIHIHVQTGNVLSHAGGFDLSGRTDIKAVSIARPVLHEILVEGAKKEAEMVEVRYGAKVKEVEEDEKGVTAVLQNGERIQGDLLIGCDGIGSDVRKHILGDRNPDPEYSGLLFVGAVTSTSKITFPPAVKPPSFCYNPHGAFLFFAMDESNQVLQWATSLELPERDRKTGWKAYQESGEVIEDMRREYADTTAEPIRSFVDDLSPSNAKLWAPYMIPDLPTWHTKRAVILGDAAHAIPPSVGQGSAMAFEDIALLSRLLGDSQSVAHGYDNLFEWFEQTRRSRLGKIRKAAMNAEGTRRPTKNGIVWWAKTLGVRAAMWAFGKDGYLTGSDIIAYDVTKEPLDVGSVSASGRA